MLEQADEVSGRSRGKPIIVQAFVAERIQQAEWIEHVFHATAEMVSVILCPQHLEHLFGCHFIHLCHLRHRSRKHALQFLRRYAT